ncbi:MAG: hypothetical protein WEA09_13495 [Gemmatimonadota bacterium]
MRGRVGWHRLLLGAMGPLLILVLSPSGVTGQELMFSVPVGGGGNPERPAQSVRQVITRTAVGAVGGIALGVVGGALDFMADYAIQGPEPELRATTVGIVTGYVAGSGLGVLTAGQDNFQTASSRGVLAGAAIGAAVTLPLLRVVEVPTSPLAAMGASVGYHLTRRYRQGN